MANIQDEVRGEDNGQLSGWLLAGLIAIPCLAAAVAIGVVLFLRAGSDDPAIPDSASTEATEPVTTEDTGVAAFDSADLTILLAEGFITEGDGEVIPEVDELVAEIAAINGVENAMYVGPSKIYGFVPDAPTLTVDGHQILVRLSDPSMLAVIVDEYEDHPIVVSVRAGT